MSTVITADAFTGEIFPSKAAQWAIMALFAPGPFRTEESSMQYPRGARNRIAPSASNARLECGTRRAARSSGDLWVLDAPKGAKENPSLPTHPLRQANATKTPAHLAREDLQVPVLMLFMRSTRMRHRAFVSVSNKLRILPQRARGIDRLARASPSCTALCQILIAQIDA